jgi:hypothetical protein
VAVVSESEEKLFQSCFGAAVAVEASHALLFGLKSKVNTHLNLKLYTIT